MKPETVRQLQKIAKPIVFTKDEYICYEGEPGNEMYIILKGLVGVYVTNAMGALVEVSQINVGDFFGEMAIFDKLPRSATCIALEDTICVAINKDNLLDFLCQCPDMAEQILKNMSTRIRKLNNDLYKNSRQVKVKKVEPFAIPDEYGFSHVVKEPYQNPKYFSEFKQKCPVCGRIITLTNIKRHLMEVKNVDLDGRINYMMSDPLWYEIMTCPHCFYSNYGINFFNINEIEVEKLRKLLKLQHVPVVKDSLIKKTKFDEVVFSYLQAIHINEMINGSDSALLGTLWLYLYWLARDAGDDKFRGYCVKKAIEKLKEAIDENQIDDATTRCSISLSLASLYGVKMMAKQMKQYSDIALECIDDGVRGRAEKFVERYSS